MDVDLDANNNSTDKKGYSLRPRSVPKSTEIEVAQEEVRKPRGRTQKPSKNKTLPLSKYRRKTANARERSRMREINEAFETLRRSIPLIGTKCDNPSEKNTKISTLRLAMKYITVLSNALRDSEGESDKESIFSEYSLTPPDCRESYTPTSTSDNSDFSDPFYITTASQETSSSCVSPFSNSSSLNFSDFTSKRLPSWTSSSDRDSKAVLVNCGQAEEQQLVSFTKFKDGSLIVRPKSPPPYPLSRLSSLEDTDLLDSSTSYSTQLLPLGQDLKYTSLTPISLQFQSTPVLEDWDDLNFSRVDFDELLST